ASQLGSEVERFKRISLGAGALLAAAAVSVSGVIGFVGLMTPHIMRLVVGSDHRRLLPASILGGAIFLVLADLAARTVISPEELPVGAVTALLGAPFFLWLLRRQRRVSYALAPVRLRHSGLRRAAGCLGRLAAHVSQGGGWAGRTVRLGQDDATLVCL